MELGPADDADLLRAHGAGDRHAFGRLYDRYDRQCFLFIRRTLGPAHADAAEDLHQETWMSVATHAGSYDARKSSFATWLFAIARNKVWDYFRRQKVAVLATGEDDAAMMVADPGPTPFEWTQSRELALTLIAAVDALPVVQRETFVMFAQGGLSLDEIAGATNVGVETTKSRLRYARAALKRIMPGPRSANG